MASACTVYHGILRTSLLRRWYSLDFELNDYGTLPIDRLLVAETEDTVSTY